jgi:hypothetical protein
MLSIVNEIIAIEELRRVTKIFINFGKVSGYIFEKW